MRHVRLALYAGGREGEIHPMYDVLVNAPFVDRATAMHWNVDRGTGELGIMHHVEGDLEQFRTVVEETPEVIEFELTPASDDAFYVYIRDEMTPVLRDLFELVTESPAVVVPPVEYAEDGSVRYSVYGPEADIQAAIDRFPDQISVDVREVSGLAGVPGVLESLLSSRQRAALEAAVSLGYYDVPRSASVADVGAEIGCATSTAAEHLRKGESKLLRAVLGR